MEKFIISQKIAAICAKVTVPVRLEQENWKKKVDTIFANVTYCLVRMPVAGCFFFFAGTPPKSSKYKARLGVSRPIYINVDSPNLGLPSYTLTF